MSGISSIYILDHKGRVLIGRSYRGDVPYSTFENFNQKLLELDETQVKPVIIDEQNQISYFYKKVNNICFLLVSKKNSNVIMIFEFLQQLISLFQQYFDDIEEESIRDNFVCIYELLDEMVDNGYPQSTNEKILKDFITTENYKLQKTQTSGGGSNNNDKIYSVSLAGNAQRKEGIVYSKNEIFLDVIEKVNMLIASNANVIKSEIIGVLNMKAYVTGVPTLKLGLNDKLMYEMQGRADPRRKTVELNDVKFHPCVQLQKFEIDRSIEFVPPDGDFELLTYRLDIQVKPLIMVEVIQELRNNSRIDLFIRAKSNFKAKCIANNVEMFIPVPCDVQNPKLKTTQGRAIYNSAKEAIQWNIKQYAGHKDYSCTASFSFPSVISPDRENFAKQPISLEFEIPYFTVSGIQVRYLKVLDQSDYQSFPWVRYISRNGDYHIRMGLQ